MLPVFAVYSGPLNAALAANPLQCQVEADRIARPERADALIIPLPSDADLNSEDTPPRLRGGKLDLFEGDYSCVGPNGKQTKVRVSLVLKNARVVQFMMGPLE